MSGDLDQVVTFILLFSAVLLLFSIIALGRKLKSEAAANQATLEAELNALRMKYEADLERYSKIIDQEAEVRRLQEEANKIEAQSKVKAEELEADFNSRKCILEEEIRDINQKIIASRSNYSEAVRSLTDINNKIQSMSDEVEYFEIGIYKPKFDYHDSASYQQAIIKNKDDQKSLIKRDGALFTATNWTVNGSEAEGKRMIKKYSKLLLRAFNSECDAAILSARYNNVEKLVERIEKSFSSLNDFGSSMSISISLTYKSLRIQELNLKYELELKRQEEKEILREERELQKENERAEREYNSAIEKQRKAERDFEKATALARKQLEAASAEEKAMVEERIRSLEQELEETKRLAERAKSQAQITRSGHVYVISNMGSFGENVYKIGLTRRLEPEERVDELGSASVPFKFDIHALIYSDDAPALERDLHRHFSNRRVNMVNQRKEFFNVPLEEIKTKILELGYDTAFEEFPKALEYRQTLHMLGTAMSESKTEREQVQLGAVTY